ncbi:hypothetical protein D3C85_1594410 [compost metagenome]
MQAEAGVAVEQPVGGDVLFGAGEFDDVVEGLAELFFAVEGQDVEGQVGVEDVQLVAAVVEEDGQLAGHLHTSIAASCPASWASEKCRVTP